MVSIDFLTTPSNRFAYVGADGTPEGLYATPEGINKVRLSGDSAVPRSVHDKRASYVSCSHDQQEEIRKTIPVAQNSALMAYYHIYKMGTPTERYVRWFGFQDPHRREKTQRILGWVSATDFSSFQFNCTCDYAVVEKGTEAYTRMYIFRLWDHYSVTDVSLDQAIGSPGTCGSANPSSNSLSITVPVYFSTRSLTSSLSAGPQTTSMV